MHADGCWLPSMRGSRQLCPEEPSALMNGTLEGTADAAATLGIRAQVLQATDMVDAIIDERSDAANEPAPFIARMASAISAVLASIVCQPASRLGHDGQRPQRLPS